MEPVSLWNNDNFIVLQHIMTHIKRNTIPYLEKQYLTKNF